MSRYSQNAIISFFKYPVVASVSPSHLEAHVGLLRLLMKGIDPYEL